MKTTEQKLNELNNVIATMQQMNDAEFLITYKWFIFRKQPLVMQELRRRKMLNIC